ncbi:hypothetical protein DPMN_065310 [Dreissena polymorpha]|uniref:Uncharacterized protein n=1 Tax=Dreissena polymorpha TaxID=45954 RepID=A0A9D4CDU2_DREPO|nr:hypothetical protein DPMN_065310 [Dreissena polymorpha]
MQYTYTTSCTNKFSSCTSGHCAVRCLAVPAGISFHLIGRELHPWQHGPVILMSHKPGTSLQGGRGTGCHWHYTPLTLLFLGRPPTHQGIVPPNVIVSPPQTSRRTRGSILTISRTPMPLS